RMLARQFDVAKITVPARFRTMSRQDKSKYASRSALPQVAQRIREKRRHVAEGGKNRRAHPHLLQPVVQRGRKAHRHIIVGGAPAQGLIMLDDLFITFARNWPACEHSVEKWTHFRGFCWTTEPD